MDEKKIEETTETAPAFDAGAFRLIAAEPDPTALGDVVIYTQNGSEAAAIVTRVWSPSCVNLTVFGDDGGTYAVTSVTNEPSSPRSWRRK